MLWLNTFDWCYIVFFWTKSSCISASTDGRDAQQVDREGAGQTTILKFSFASGGGEGRCLLCTDLQSLRTIEEGWNKKTRQRSSRLFGGKICWISCRAHCFASVDLEETVKFFLFFQIDRGKTANAARNWTHSAPQTDATTFALSSNSIAAKNVHPFYLLQ